MALTWFITGASSGFGRALAEGVLERGHRAVVGARRISVLEELASKHPDRTLAVQLNVTDPQQRERAVAEALHRFRRIDVLANIAGRGSLGAAEEFTLEHFESRWK